MAVDARRRSAPGAELARWRLKPLVPIPRRARYYYGLQMPRRGPGVAWLAQTLTLGAGHVRWLHTVCRELGEFDVRGEVNLRRTTLAVLPGGLLVVPALVAWYRLGSRIARAQRAAGLAPTCRPVLGLLLAPPLGAITWYYQRELNKIVDRYGYPAGVAVALDAQPERR